MNKNIHGIIIAMLAVGLLITGAGVYLLSTQLASVAMSVKSIERGLAEKMLPSDASVPTKTAENRIAIEEYCDTNATGLCFSYPKGWTITHYDDQFTGGQVNLQIEDSSSGIRVTFEKLHPGQSGMKGPPVASYANLYELGEMCDGPTCPMDQYYFQHSLGGDTFAIRTYYKVTDSTYASDVRKAKPFLDTILQSLQIGLY